MFIRFVNLVKRVESFNITKVILVQRNIIYILHSPNESSQIECKVDGEFYFVFSSQHKVFHVFTINCSRIKLKLQTKRHGNRVFRIHENENLI